MRGERVSDPSRRRRASVVVGVFAISALALFAARAFELRVNWTDSMPRGLYQRVDPELVRGEWIALCLDGEAAKIARERAYVIAGSCPSGLIQIVKKIAAVPGDRVELGSDGVRINGERIAASELHDRDRRGAPLEHAPEGEFVLAEGAYWVLGANLQLSWDSRYFGPVKREQIVGGAQPVWTF